MSADFASKLQAAVANAQARATEQPTPPAPEEVTPEPQAEPAPPEEAKAPDPQAEAQELRSKQLAALARRDRELREREEALKAREEANTAQAKPQPFTLDVTKIQDPLDLQAYAIHREFGDDAPQDIKDRVARLEYEQRLNQIESSPQKAQPDEDDIRARVREETMIAMKISEVHSVVDSGIPSEYALLSAEAQEEPMEVKQAIAQHMDNVRAIEGRWCSVNEAIKALNDAMEAEALKYDRLRGVNKPATAAPTKPGANTSHEAPLSDAELSSTPDRGSEPFETDVMKRIARAKAKLGIG